EGILSDDFVAFLVTKKGTQYALTLKDADKLFDFFYGRYINEHFSEFNQNKLSKYQNSLKNYDKVKWKYFNPDNPNRKIKRTDTNNQNVLNQFLHFLNEADAGVQLFKADESFDTFTSVNLENGI